MDPCPPLRILGARQNNLAGFDLEIPHDRLVVLTGVSGSGKSSLAFDTVFAEGQWRFLESLPSYARLLLEKMARPRVDGLENVRPAIALAQHNAVRAARSTVGTSTELYDLFRLLFSAAGEVHCPSCGREARAWTPDAAARAAVARWAGGRVQVEVPLPSLAWLPSRGWAADLSARGFARAWVRGETRRLDEPGLPDALPEGALVVDRVTGRDGRTERLARALDEAFRLGSGIAQVRGDDGEVLPFGTSRRCHACNRDLPDPRPVLFSFNHALGACPECTGFGAVLRWDEAKVVPDPARALGEGAIEPWQTPANRWWQEELERLAEDEGIPMDVPWEDLPPGARDKVWHGTERLEGIDAFFEYLESKRYKMHVRVFLARYRTPATCGTCGGARLRPEALGVTLAGKNISQANAMSLGELARWCEGLGSVAGGRARDVLWRIEDKLATLLRLGLHYLTMERATRTLSGGEAQRAALALQLQNRLAGTLYVLDEPTVGLHPRDVHVLGEVLAELTTRGNTALVVEHDLSLVRRADHVIELGPGGGHRGGRVLYEGAPEGMTGAGTPTGRHLARRGAAPRGRPARSAQGHLFLGGCRLHNLRAVDVSIPLGVLTCVTGVSGSGKSSLVSGTLVPALAGEADAQLDRMELRGGRVSRVQEVDQSPMGRTPRSIPLTYLGAYQAVRSLFAALPASRKAGLSPRSFSFNVPGGRCETCKGTGFEKLEMLFFEDLYVPCDACAGRRFGPEVLSVRYRGLSIREVLDLTVEEALTVFEGSEDVCKALRALEDLGLGYLVLGQPGTTLSGGEAQRLRIAAELLGRGPRDGLYVLDEPTTGLHPEDVDRLLAVLQRLTEAGNTVVVVEHNLDLISHADWIVDLGPEGGDGGGRIVDVGTPEEVARRSLGPTGRFLKPWLGDRLA